MVNKKFTNAATDGTAKPGKRISLREYGKSVLFLAAIYTLIINQANNEKPDIGVFQNETVYQENVSKTETSNRQIFFPSIVYSGIKVLFYPSNLLWK